MDVLGLNGDFIDSDIEYTSDEEDEVEKTESKSKGNDFRLTAQISLVSRFSSNLIHAVLICAFHLANLSELKMR